jgi:hypothetical protein
MKDVLEAHKKWLESDGKEGQRANLRRANLTDADLTDADLTAADLRRADLRGADLTDADLRAADLTDANGIVSFGPVGDEGRIGYAVAHEDEPRVQLGCFWGAQAEAVTAIRKKYGADSAYEALVVAACEVLTDDKV